MHGNWVFSAPGTYRIEVGARSGDRQLTEPQSFTVIVRSGHHNEAPAPADEEPVPTPSPGPSPVPEPIPRATPRPPPTPPGEKAQNQTKKKKKKKSSIFHLVNFLT